VQGDAEIDHDGIEYVYEQFADAITARVESGYYTIKLPAERALAEEFGVSYITVRHAMKILREHGLIVSIQGRGTYVAPDYRIAPQSAEIQTPTSQSQSSREKNLHTI
jgi:GntR family transcriptional regulator